MRSGPCDPRETSSYACSFSSWQPQVTRLWKLLMVRDLILMHWRLLLLRLRHPATRKLRDNHKIENHSKLKYSYLIYCTNVQDIQEQKYSL